MQYCFKIPALANCLSRQAKLQTGVFLYLVSHYLPLGVWITVKLIINYAFKDLRSLLGLLFKGTKEMQELHHHHNHWAFRSMFLLLYSWKDKVLKIYFVCAYTHIRVQVPTETWALLQMKLQAVVNHPMAVQFQFRDLKLHMNFENSPGFTNSSGKSRFSLTLQLKKKNLAFHVLFDSIHCVCTPWGCPFSPMLIHSLSPFSSFSPPFPPLSFLPSSYSSK